MAKECEQLMSEFMAVGYANSTAQSSLLSEKINGFTFYYNPAEITLDDKTRAFLANFRTDDGEDCFTLTQDDEGLVIY